ncbi:MAG: PhzF family phenazine biosynthesis protein [Nitrosomonadales bacterium]|nr:PhzF family phenazine biosynthesis protein [Nitrosomonadales bacterium]
MKAGSARKVAFRQVDVFTSVPFMGNPVAVILDGEGLSTGQMQSIANWTNLSETTFVCAPTHPDADYRLRIFTPRSELPFAGHPTLGSAHALLQQGLQPRTPGRLVQECGKGLIDLRIVGHSLFFALPQPVFAAPDAAQLAAVAEALGVQASGIVSNAIVDVGAVWLTLQLPSAQGVIGLKPDMARLAALGCAQYIGVTVFGLYEAGNAAVEVRSFAPACGVPEDPVCGSGNGCVAALIRRHKILPVSAYTASQGRCLGRDGYVQVEFAADGNIWLGGNAVTCIEGKITARA